MEGKNKKGKKITKISKRNKKIPNIYQNQHQNKTQRFSTEKKKLFTNILLFLALK